MSGSAAAGGFEFQAEAFAFVAAHGIAETPLGWFDENAVPMAISMETGGPGDDMRIELSDGSSIELQAKKGLSRGIDFSEAIISLAKGVLADSKLSGVLLVDSGASRPIRETLRQEFLRLSDGRSDSLKTEMTEILAQLADAGISDRSIFRRLRIVAKDFLPGGDGKAAAHSLLQMVLSNSTEAAGAWSTLAELGMALSARRGRCEIGRIASKLHLKKESKDRLCAAEHYRKWVTETNTCFPVPALNIRMDINEVWDCLRWLETEVVKDSKQSKLNYELKRYHEWARLAEERNGETGTCGELLDQVPYLVVIGGPGSGKSTLLRRVAHDESKAGKLVLRFSLRQVMCLMKEGTAFEKAVATAAAQGSSVDPTVLERLIGQADMLLAEGLDETDPIRLVVAQSLHEWAHSHPRSKVCVTTRPIGHQSALLPGFRAAELLPLSENESERLSAKLFNAIGISFDNAQEHKSHAQRYLIRRSRSTEATSIARRSPLLLSFIVKLQADGQPINGPRAVLYSRIVDLIQYTPVDRVTNDAPNVQISRWMLSALAWKLLSEPDCTRHKAIEFLSTELAASGASHVQAALLSESVAIFWEHKRLLERIHFGAEEIVTFVHHTLAEFCAAEYVSKMSDERLVRWLTDHRRESQWKNAIQLACGTGALAQILPPLLAMDEPKHPCSDEVIICAIALVEAKNSSPELLKQVIEKLAARLSSDVPLISLEAAENLAIIAPLKHDLIQLVCRPLIHSKQDWTRLGAYAALLASSSKELSAEEVCSWLRDSLFSKKRRSSFVGDSEETLELVRSLRSSLWSKALRLAFIQLPKDGARSVARDVLNRGDLSAFDMIIMEEVLVEYHSSDLIHELIRLSKPLPDMNRFNENLKATIKAFFRLIPFVVTYDKAERVDFDPRLPNLSSLLTALDWWNVWIGDIARLGHSFSEQATREVLKATIQAIGLPPDALVEEVNFVLQQDDPSNAFDLSVALRKKRSEIQWNISNCQAIEAEGVVDGLFHPSAIIRVAAFELINAGAGGSLVSERLKLLLPKSSNHTLACMAILGRNLWGEEAVDLLIQRFHSTPEDGVESICPVLADLATKESDRTKITSLLLGAIKHRNSAIAKSAVNSLSKLKIPATPQYRTVIQDALQYWQGVKFKCTTCGLEYNNGRCPTCTLTIALAIPFEPLVHELARIQCLSAHELFKLSQSDWLEIRRPAIEELNLLILVDPNALRTILQYWQVESASTDVLEEILKNPAHQLSPFAADLLTLLDSASSRVRAQILRAFPLLPLDGKRLRILAQNALGDRSAEVRDAAASTIRLLESSEFTA